MTRRHHTIEIIETEFDEAAILMITAAVQHHPWTDTRLTPKNLRARLREAMPGLVDVCPTGGINGLSPWPENAYCNPPGSLLLEFAHRWRSGRGSASWCHFNWDHSTEWFHDVHSATDAYALLHDRHKFEGPGEDPETGRLVWKLWDVGRSQAFAFRGIPLSSIQGAFGDIAHIVPARRVEDSP